MGWNFCPKDKDWEMKTTIIQHLRQIEQSESVRILYACESGSRAWGFPSQDSDYDVRFLYVRPREWYLRIDVERQRDVIELPIEGLLDINGWDLKKALNLFCKSNPSLMEWLDSPVVYRQDERFLLRLKSLLPRYYSPSACYCHYTHMAQGNYREYLRGEQVRTKKYFYVLRPLLAMRWIERGLGRVPMKFSVLVDRLVDEPELRQAIEQLMAEKRRGLESVYGPRIASISDFIEKELARQSDNLLSLPKAQPSYEALNALFLDMLNVA